MGIPIAGDGSFLVGVPYFIDHKEREIFSRNELLAQANHSKLILFSPSLQLLKNLHEKRISLFEVGWRDFEKLVAELLEQDGYEIELGKGTKDRGVDIRARKHLPNIGYIQTVWQAKHLISNKVGLNIIRELADTTLETGSSNGIIVTSSKLTRGAIDRITRDCYKLGKVDRDDLGEWIKRIMS